MQVQIKLVSDKFPDISLPKYETEGSAGMDVCAAIENDIIIAPGAVALVATNLSIALPRGYECQVRSRSGLSIKNGVFCLNAPGTIDSDYRGEIKVILANFGKEEYVVARGARIAQLVIAKYEQIKWELCEELSETNRGEGGFGSTGV
jgi:dUTP pyrophosphatase